MLLERARERLIDSEITLLNILNSMFIYVAGAET